MDDLTREIRDTGNTSKQELRILGMGFYFPLLHDICEQFSVLYPDIRLGIDFSAPQDFLSKMMSGAYDIGVSFQLTDLQGTLLDFTPLERGKFCVVVSPPSPTGNF